MDPTAVLRELEALGTEQNRKVYRRHGASEPLLGVSYADLGKLQKRIKKDHALARALWSSGYHDARVLATMVADPAAADLALLESWAAGLPGHPLADALAGFAARTPAARAAMERWMASGDEWTASAGWGVLAALANQEDGSPDSSWESFLARIEREIHGSPNRVRHAMNGALIAIGSRSDALAARATAAAARIGKVEVNHGETGCKTPDAAAYIRKTREHRTKRAAGKTRR